MWKHKVRSFVIFVLWLLGFLQEGLTQVWASRWVVRGIWSQEAEKDECVLILNALGLSFSSKAKTFPFDLLSLRASTLLFPK